MDQLMNSLLVWREGELMPASSAASLDEAEKQSQNERIDSPQSESTRPRMATTSGPVSDVTSHSQRVRDLVSERDRPRVVNTGELPPASAQGCHKRAQHVTAETPVSSPAEHALTPPRPKLGTGTQSRARRSSSATPLQLLQANIEAFENSDLPGDKMDRNYQLAPNVGVENTSSNHSLLLGGPPVEMQSMVDFEQANPYTPPPRKVIPRKASTHHGEYASLFHMTCQDRGLKPDFQYREVAKGCFDVTLTIDGQKVDTIGQYDSKKGAKEEICKLAMSKIDSFGNRKKRNASIFESDNLASLPANLHEERWVNIVYEYMQKAKLGPPAFEETGVHPTTGPFRCTLRLPNGPLTPFGSELGTFKKKSDAKLAAAQQAAKWLRSQGLVAQSSAKRRRSSTETQIASTTAPAAPGETGLTQTLTRQLDMNNTVEQGTLPERCTKLIVELGFSQPTFEFEPLAGAFYNAQATFNSKDGKVEPRLSGKIGRVESVYGKKQAKEQCWQEISQVLEAIRIDRMARLSQMGT